MIVKDLFRYLAAFLPKALVGNQLLPIHNSGFCKSNLKLSKFILFQVENNDMWIEMVNFAVHYQ